LTRSIVAMEGGGMRTASERWWDGPWPWLVYLVFLPLPWLWRAPDLATLSLTGIGLTLFLPLYFAAHRVRGVRLIGATAAITAIGIALAPLPVGWTVFPIYAAAAIGRARPRQTAFVAIAAIAVVTAAAGFGLSQPTLWWLPGVLLVVMTGSATVSREAFYERAQALLRTQEEVRRLAGTAERERIARDLHDVIGRTLTLVALKADLAGRLVDRDPDRAKDELAAIAGAARGGLAEVRAALAGQSGGSLSHELAASQAALATAGVAIERVGDPDQVADGAGAILAMTLREAVTNVIRHAGASQCRLDIACGANGATLTVADNGRGGSFREGNGLTGMRQRLAAAGGDLSIVTDSAGTQLRATVPA